MAIDRDELNQQWTPSCEMCGWTGEPVPEQGKAQTQYLNHCKTAEHKENKNQKKKEEEIVGGGGDEQPGEERQDERKEPPKAPEVRVERKPAMSELSENEVLTFHGEEGRRYLKRRKLEQLLSMAPDITEKILKWVMENYDQDEMAKRDLNALYMLLMNCKVKPEYAGRIVQMIMAMEQKWWNDQNGQNTGMYFPQGPQGEPGNQGRPVFYDQFGRPVPTPFPNQVIPYNNQDQRGNHGYYPVYPQRQPNPDIERLEKAVGDLANTVKLLNTQPKPEEPKITRDDIAEMVVSAVAKATEKPSLTKEDITEVVREMVFEKNKEDLLVTIADEIKGMKGDIIRLEKNPRTPLPKDISEEGSIEVKKLDIIGNKLGDLHETVKHGMSLLLSPEDKPKPRSGDDITRLDEELDRMATPGGG